MADLKWRDVFSDEKLQVLIEEGLKNNYDLKNALINIAQAEAGFRQSKMDFFPNVNFTPQITHNKTSREALNLPPTININLRTTTVQLGFSANWELDVWGKLASAKKAAFANYLQLGATQRAIQTALIANIANNYFMLMALDKQLKIAEQTVEIRKKTIKTLKTLADAGRVTGADVVQSEANLHAAQVLIPDLKLNIRRVENQLCMLLSKSPQAIERSSLELQQFNIDLNSGIPLLLLKNRPDVEAAELAFRQAFEMTNVAKTQFYPTFTISAANLGISALSTKNLFGASLFYNIVGGIAQPIFNRAVIKTNYKVSKLKQEQALNNFEKTVLSAGIEVSNALYAYETVSEKQLNRSLQVAALEKAVSLNMKLLEFSERTTYTDVLNAEQNLLSSQLSEVMDQLQKHEAVIELYRALGGGWR
jgi:NodT family efflux transporter outer membrane factor (OMF) lipoprotein